MRNRSGVSSGRDLLPDDICPHEKNPLLRKLLFNSQVLQDVLKNPTNQLRLRHRLFCPDVWRLVRSRFVRVSLRGHRTVEHPETAMRVGTAAPGEYVRLFCGRKEDLSEVPD